MSSVAFRIRDPFSKAEIGLIITAVAALLLGAAVYVLDRDWASSMFLEPLADNQWQRSAVFGAFGRFLPALTHAYAFCVLIIVTLWPWPWTRLWVCLLWFTIASTLEWLQSGVIDAWLLVLGRLPDEIPLMAYLERYALQGTFDNIDLLATGVGCLIALVVTSANPSNRKRNDV